jgi:hypothetical protein
MILVVMRLLLVLILLIITIVNLLFLNKHIELWVKNAFDEWYVFHGFDIQKFIRDLFKTIRNVRDLVNMIFSFVLQVTKKDGNMYLITRYIFSFQIVELSFVFYCLQKDLGHRVTLVYKESLGFKVFVIFQFRFKFFVVFNKDLMYLLFSIRV